MENRNIAILDLTFVKITGEHTTPQELKSHLAIMHELLQACKEELAEHGDMFNYEIID